MPNFGLLQPLQAHNQVIAQLPQNNQTDNMASGILEGLKTGSNLQSQALSRDATRQEMEQKAQLFPSQLSQEQSKAEGMQIDLAGKKRSQEDELSLRAAAIAGPDEYEKQLMQISPPEAQKYQLSKAQTQKAFSEVAEKNADTRHKVLSNYDLMIDHAAQVMRAAAAGATPEMQQAIYQFGLKQLDPDTQKAMPPVYDPHTGMAISRLAHESAASIAAKEKAKNPEKGLPQISKLQEQRDALQEKVNNGTASAQETQNLKEINQNITKEITPTKMYANPTDQAISKADEESLKTIQKSNSSIPRQREIIDSALSNLEKTPGQLLNPVSGWLSLAKLNPEGQALISNLNSLTLNAKEQFNMGSQGFTDADREFVKAINGDISNYKGTLKQLLEQSKSLTDHAAIENWVNESTIQKKGSGYDAWLEQHPEPKVKVNIDGQEGTIPASKLREAQFKFKAKLK